MEITPLAIEKLKEVIEQEEDKANSLRVIATPSGDGGLQYMLTMEKETQPDDTIFSSEGLSFLMDSDSAPFLEEASGGSGGCGGGGGGGGCGCGGH